MLFPEDEEKRRELIACFLRAREISGKGAVADPLDPPLFQVLAKYIVGSVAESRAILDGAMAGWVLKPLSMIHEHHLEYGASINKAILVVAADAARYSLKTYDGRGSVPGTARSVRAAWRKYRNLAHLWAAHGILLAQGIPPVTKRGMTESNKFESLQEMVDTSRDWQKLLAIAEEIHKFADRLFNRYRSEAKGELIWDNDLVWRAPDGVVPPMRSLVPPQLSQKSLNDLINYCAGDR